LDYDRIPMNLMRLKYDVLVRGNKKLPLLPREETLPCIIIYATGADTEFLLSC
jgi:hypothetical protein